MYLSPLCAQLPMHLRPVRYQNDIQNLLLFLFIYIEGLIWEYFIVRCYHNKVNSVKSWKVATMLIKYPYIVTLTSPPSISLLSLYVYIKRCGGRKLLTLDASFGRLLCYVRRLVLRATVSLRIANASSNS